ncbi:hypothetical protein BBP40_003369 [Aspergillus hancockii]|nr:hypothetical protein BBP40_003369 [Aspergillus hancockii]
MLPPTSTMICIKDNVNKLTQDGLLDQYGYEFLHKDGKTYIVPTPNSNSQWDYTALMDLMAKLGYKLWWEGRQLSCQYMP